MIEWEPSRDLSEEAAALLQAEMTPLLREASNLGSYCDTETALNLILDLALALQQADFGNVQLYRQERRVLEIVRQRGFTSDFLKAFEYVSADDSCACGLALKVRYPIVVPDVEQDIEFAPYWPVIREAGYRAVQSYPMISKAGQPVGVISTHFRKPGMPSAVNIYATSLLARQSAELIARLDAWS
jgi:GAF domain-containing protein